jgi:hypothetical protein
MLESSDVPLNSSSRLQCQVPDGAAIGGAVPEQGPPGTAAKNGGAEDVPGAADGAAVPAPAAPPGAAVPGVV